MNEKIYAGLVNGIIGEMKKIIGPVAVTQANTVDGLAIDKKITIKRDGYEVVTRLIEKYKTIMGPVAVTIAKKGVEAILEKNPKLKVPEELR